MKLKFAAILLAILISNIAHSSSLGSLSSLPSLPSLTVGSNGSVSEIPSNCAYDLNSPNYLNCCNENENVWSHSHGSAFCKPKNIDCAMGSDGLTKCCEPGEDAAVNVDPNSSVGIGKIVCI